MPSRKYAKIERICAVCGSIFRVFPSEAYRKHCGRQCNAKAQRSRATPIEERFWKKVDKNGPAPSHRPDLGPCWLWTGAVCPTSGYGNIGGYRDDGSYGTLNAHAVSYRLHFGPPSQCVLHHCDVRRCVAPLHLYDGSKQQNAADMVSRGRHASHVNPSLRRGERHGRAKLTWAKIDEIRRRFTDGETQTELAVAYGVTQASIHNIVRRKSWKQH